MQFSVVIPTHERDDYLVTAVESVVSQTLAPVEVIVVDDVPSAQTRQAVEELARTTDIPVRYFENIGIRDSRGSRNLGSAHAGGEYLAFLDDDDYWAPNYLERVATLIGKTKADVVISNTVRFEPDGTLSEGKTVLEDYSMEKCILSNPGYLPSGTTVRRLSYFQVGGFDHRVLGSADKDLIMSLKQIGCSHAVINEGLVYWRVGHAQVSSNPAKVAKSVKRFYWKYFNKMSLELHYRMLKKILRLHVRSIRRKVKNKMTFTS